MSRKHVLHTLVSIEEHDRNAGPWCPAIQSQEESLEEAESVEPYVTFSALPKQLSWRLGTIHISLIYQPLSGVLVPRDRNLLKRNPCMAFYRGKSLEIKFERPWYVQSRVQLFYNLTVSCRNMTLIRSQSSLTLRNIERFWRRERSCRCTLRWTSSSGW